MRAPNDWQTYKGLIDKRCWTARKDSRMRQRSIALRYPTKDWRKLTGQQRAYRWQKFLNEVYEKEIAPNQRLKQLKIERKLHKREEKKRQAGLMSSNGKRIANMNGELNVVFAGARTGKTHAISQILNNNALQYPGWVQFVVGESYPKMKAGGVISTFEKALRTMGTWELGHMVDGGRAYKYNNGSICYFISGINNKGGTGQECDEYFFNEWDMLPWDYTHQIITRCRHWGWADFNPRNEFEFNRIILPHAENYKLQVLTGLKYTGNEFLTQSQIDGILTNLSDPIKKKIYIDGTFPETDFRIYRNWQVLMAKRNPEGDIVTRIPVEARLIGHGLDFGGFNIMDEKANSRMAVCSVYEYLTGYLLDEMYYQEKASYEETAAFLKGLQSQGRIYADRDNAGIATLKRLGVNLIPARKGSGSVEAGIKLMQDKPIWITEDSQNLWAEYNRYYWQQDSVTGLIIAKPRPKTPQDLLDAARYVIYSAHGKMDQNSIHRLNARVRTNIGIRQNRDYIIEF